MADIDIETQELVDKMTLAELWNNFDRWFRDGIRVTQDDYQRVKYGKGGMPFHIKTLVYFTEGDERYIKEMPRTGTVKIGMKKFHLYKFWEEMQERETLMRKKALEVFANEENKTVGR